MKKIYPIFIFSTSIFFPEKRTKEGIYITNSTRRRAGTQTRLSKPEKAGNNQYKWQHQFFLLHFLVVLQSSVFLLLSTLLVHVASILSFLIPPQDLLIKGPPTFIPRIRYPADFLLHQCIFFANFECYSLRCNKFLTFETEQWNVF